MRNIKHENQLLGALIGLAKSCESHPMTEEATRCIIESLEFLSESKEATKEESKETTKKETEEERRTYEERRVTCFSLIQKVHAEKHRIVPNCATCASPCGNTSDYDLDLMWKAREEVKEAKLNLVKALEEIACEIKKAQETEPASTLGENQNLIYDLYRGLATISFDYSPEEIKEVISQIRS